MPFTLVSIYLSTLTLPFSNSKSISPIPSKSGTLPIDNNAFSATISSLPSTLIVNVSPLSTISLIAVEVKIFIPFFSNSFLNVSEDSLSTPGIILSIISTTVTSEPNELNTCPNSIPTTPPPITANDLGICWISKISSLVITFGLSIPGILILPTFEPPAKMILSVLNTVSPLSFVTTTSLSTFIFPIPL